MKAKTREPPSRVKEVVHVLDVSTRVWLRDVQIFMKKYVIQEMCKYTCFYTFEWNYKNKNELNKIKNIFFNISLVLPNLSNTTKAEKHNNRNEHK